MANFIFRDRSKYAVVGKGFFDLVNANPPLNWGDMQQEVKNLIVSNGAVDPADGDAPVSDNDIVLHKDLPKKANMAVPTSIDNLDYLKEDAQFLCGIVDADEQALALLGLYLMKRCR